MSEKCSWQFRFCEKSWVLLQGETVLIIVK